MKLILMIPSDVSSFFLLWDKVRIKNIDLKEF